MVNPTLRSIRVPRKIKFVRKISFSGVRGKDSGDDESPSQRGTDQRKSGTGSVLVFRQCG